MAPTLPSFSILKAKQVLPPERYNTLLLSVISALNLVLKPKNPAAVFDAATAHGFIARYAHERAQFYFSIDASTLPTLARPPTMDQAERHLNADVLTLAYRIPKTMITTTFLQDLLLISQSGHDIRLVHKVLDSCHLLSEFTSSLKLEVIQEFTTTFSTPFKKGEITPESFITSRLRLSHLINSWLRVKHEETTLAFAQSKELPIALAQCYNIDMKAIADSLGRVKLNGKGASSGWEVQWIETKVGLLDSFHYVVDYIVGAIRATSDESELIGAFFANLVRLMELYPGSGLPSSRQRRFIDRTFLADYELTHHLSGRLEEVKFQSLKHASVIDFIVTGLRKMQSAPSENDGDALGGLRILFGDVVISQPPKSGTQEGTMANSSVASLSDQESHLTMEVTRVLDIFPDESQAFIRSALLDPSFAKSSERVIAALLEGTPLPPELQRLREGGSEDTLPERRNIFEDEMDYSRLRIGKNRHDASATLHNRAAMEEIKAEILRRVAEQSDDELDDAVQAAPFEDELDYEVALAGKGIKLSGLDGEESTSSEDEEMTNVNDVPPSANVDTILELAYLKDPKLFDRDTTTRKSPARQELKEQTGWIDEQIEGWRIMLERNPRKHHILSKHEFSGNRPQLGQHNLLFNHSSNQGRSGAGQGSSRGGSRGRGRGRGRGHGFTSSSGDAPSSHTMSAHDRAFKERNKSNVRTRGHDKKLARGGL